MATYFAAVLARTSRGWKGRELEMAGIEDLDALADQMRDVGDGDPRTFISDDRAVGTSALAELVMQDVVVPEPVEDEEEGIKPAPEAVGDADIVADLGVSADTLLELCAEEGYLPSDIMTAICEKAGCVDVLDEIRGT